MLYITIANALVYLMSLSSGNTLYYLLCFDRAKILQGEVWRLITCVTTAAFGYRNPILAFVGFLCFLSLGKAVENVWGTFRFNLFYFSGVLLMDVFAMLIGGIPLSIAGLPAEYSALITSSIYSNMGHYIHLSLLIAYATLYPNSHFLLFYIIPVKAWIFGLLYLGIVIYDVFTMYYVFPHNLFPLVGVANYFLFFGKDIVNLFPMSWRLNASRLFRKKKKYAPTNEKPKVVPFPGAGSYQATTATVKAPYTHRCTVCGKTDVDAPDLEFRYCSRCKGYHCYCEEHISNHNHVE
jgi:hypothetical protein